MAKGHWRTASGKLPGEVGIAFLDKTVRPNIGRALYGIAQDVMKESLPLVPVDTGALRGSGYVAEPKIEGDHITVELGYGGVATHINPKTLEPASTYALAVHENLEAHHKVGQAKYLQQPVESVESKIGTMIAERMKGSTQEQPQDQSGGQGEV